MTTEEWRKECRDILIHEYGFERTDADDLSFTFNEEQREDVPREALKIEFSYWGD